MRRRLVSADKETDRPSSYVAGQQGLQIRFITKHCRLAAGVHKQQVLSGFSVAGAVQETGHHPASVRRVENNSLAVSGQFDCFGNRIVNLSVARCQSLVTKIDISLANRVLDSQKNSQFPTVVDDTRLLNSACNQNSVQPFRPGRLRPKRRRNLRLAQILPSGLGHWLINARPDACCVEFDDGEEVGVVFFISCGYRPVLFEF